ncbi:hypothetical protein ScPMuIL_015058 [Solemya velum]
MKYLEKYRTTERDISARKDDIDDLPEDSEVEMVKRGAYRVSTNALPSDVEDDDDDDDYDDESGYGGYDVRYGDDDDGYGDDGLESHREKRDTDLKFADESCKTPSEGATPCRLTKRQKDSFIKKHNDFRKAFAEEQPGGVCGMWKVEWDETLAQMAQKTADNCDFTHHNHDWNGKIAGQNLYVKRARSRKSMGYATQKWNAEKSKLLRKDRLHYIQLNTYNIKRIGCAVAKCGSMCIAGRKRNAPKRQKWWYYVCNYDQQLSSHDNTPAGPDCSCCSTNMDEGYRCSNSMCTSCEPGTNGCQTGADSLSPDVAAYYKLTNSCTNLAGNNGCKVMRNMGYTCSNGFMSSSCKEFCNLC